MNMSNQPYNLAVYNSLPPYPPFPSSPPQGHIPTPPGSFPPPYPPPQCPSSPIDPKAPETWDYGFHRFITFIQSPPIGAGILAISFFFLLVFFSNAALSQVTFATLGITVTLSTMGFLALVVLILFLL